MSINKPTQSIRLVEAAVKAKKATVAEDYEVFETYKSLSHLEGLRPLDIMSKISGLSPKQMARAIISVNAFSEYFSYDLKDIANMYFDRSKPNSKNMAMCEQAFQEILEKDIDLLARLVEYK